MPMTSPPNNATAESWLESLQESGYRLTAPRRAIVSIIANAPRALDAIEIYDQGRVHQPEGCNMYMRAPQGHEHLLLCKSCGQMEYFSGDDLSKLIEETSRSSGFQIQEHWLQLGGLCANCQPPTSPEEGV
jgi:Fur family ferric uptake transcriptional regulator